MFRCRPASAPLLRGRRWGHLPGAGVGLPEHRPGCGQRESRGVPPPLAPSTPSLRQRVLRSRDQCRVPASSVPTGDRAFRTLCCSAGGCCPPLPCPPPLPAGAGVLGSPDGGCGSCLLCRSPLPLTSILQAWPHALAGMIRGHPSAPKCPGWDLGSGFWRRRQRSGRVRAGTPGAGRDAEGHSTLGKAESSSGSGEGAGSRRPASAARLHPRLRWQRRDASSKGKGKAEGRSLRGPELKRLLQIEKPGSPEGKRKEQNIGEVRCKTWLRGDTARRSQGKGTKHIRGRRAAREPGHPRGAHRQEKKK